MVGTPVPDPAAQTELIYILKKIGCDVVKDRDGTLKKWAGGYLDEGGRSAPPPTGAAAKSGTSRSRLDIYTLHYRRSP